MTQLLALTVGGWDLSLDAALIGVSTGLNYALLGAGLVLIFRATGIINFAHGEVGALAGAILARIVIQDDVNYWVALVLATGVGLAIGALTDLLVMRRLARASKLVLLAATLGLAQLLLVFQTQVPTIDEAAPYPAGFDASVSVGGVTLFGEHLMALALAPVLIIGLGVFLTRTQYGLAIRASADNENAARLAGMSPRRVSLLVWTIAGGLSALTFVLNAPIRGTIAGITSQGLGPSLLLRALAAALVGRFVSLPLTLAGGVALGIVESQAFINAPPGTVDAVVFVVVAVLLLTRMRATEGGATIARSGGAPSLSAWVSPRVRRGFVVACVAGVVLIPLVVTAPSQQVVFARVGIYAIIAVSVVVVTGWSGQLSLAQFAFAGVGAVVTHALTSQGMGFGWAVLYAMCAGVAAAIVVGLPAARIRGFFLAVTTLGFAVAAQGWLLPHSIFMGEESSGFVPRGTFGALDLASQRTFYYVVVVVLGVVLVVVHRLRSSGVGRSLLAVRENERAAEAMTISTVRTKLLAFGLAGGLAALAGALFAGLQVQFQPGAFTAAESLRVLAIAIIGGITSIAGALIGTIFVLGIPAIVGDTLTVQLLTSGVGLLLVLLIEPGGLLELVRKRAANVAGLFGIEGPRPATATLEATAEPEAAPPDEGQAPEHQAPEDVAPDEVEAPEDVAPEVEGMPAPSVSAAAPRGESTPAWAPVVLEVANVSVRFGGLTAVNDVSLEARRGEVVGLIGTNGAGKSTLLNAINGFERTAGGTIAFEGRPLDGLRPYQRSRLGIGRVFQDALLYPELTPREAIAVALEATEASEVVPSGLWLPPARVAEWRKQRRTSELIELLELGPIADQQIGELSTGSRRVVEIACLLAVDARLLLLDEPMAGVAHDETQRFVSLILQIQHELDATILVIEHDMSVVMSMSERLYCMAAGEVIAEGQPEEVRSHPEVIAAYLGGSTQPASSQPEPEMAP